jgi:hypothetical protein
VLRFRSTPPVGTYVAPVADILAAGYQEPPSQPGGPELLVRCRSALARWVAAAGAGLRALSAEETARVAAERYAARVPRPATCDARVLLPGMRRGTWFRTARLVQARAEAEFGRARPGPRTASAPPLGRVDQVAQEDAEREWRRAFTKRGVRQMIAILGDDCGADTRGRIENVGHFIARYRKAVGCSEAAAYEHWRDVRELGLVRQTRHSAGHRAADDQGRSTTHARYVLCWPAALLPESLPVEADALTAAPLAPQAAAWDHDADHVALDAGEVGLYRYGSCRTPQALATVPATCQDDPDQDDATGVSSYYLEAWPLYARVSPPSPAPGSSRSGDRPVSRPFRGVSDDERAAARRVLVRCRPLWARQGQGIADDEAAQLVPMIAIALRYIGHLGQSDLVDLLTDRVRSARALGRVLLRRLQALLRSLRNRREVPADDDGSRYAAATAQRAREAADAHASTAAARAATRTALQSVRDRLAARRREREATAPPFSSSAEAMSFTSAGPAGPAIEPEAVFAAELAARRGYTPDSAPGPPTRTELAAWRRAAAHHARLADHPGATG